MKFIYGDIKIPVNFSQTCDAQAIEATHSFVKSNTVLSGLGKYTVSLFKRSVDARKKDNVCYVYKTCIEFENVVDFLKLPEIKNTTVLNVTKPKFPKFLKAPDKPICVCGFGPCGMFCALLLARAGLRPLVLEKGSSIEKRKKDVELLWTKGVLNEKSNVQFGEGGAGTFSDGKLMTRINDPLCNFVIETFAKYGADPKITYLSKPHVGTDKLCEIVKNIREEIISLGGSCLFDSEITAINRDSKGNVSSVVINNGEEIEVSALFLAPGHSARGLFEHLLKNNFDIVSKNFSVGMRIEHLKKDIDYAMYGTFCEKYDMPAAEYSLSQKYGQRGAYSFCMCPGGTVVASASENGQIVTNGMSYSGRDGVNSNSAIAVSIMQSDFGATPMGAIEFQQKIENDAFVLAGSDSSAPIQTFGDFLNGTIKSEPSEIMPTYTGKTKLCRIDSLLPEYVTKLSRLAICAFDKQIKGFANSKAVITAPETRTSSPVRIMRNENYCATGTTNIFPCGEGAGYAGGITSAAVDGMRAAIAYMDNLKNQGV